MNEKVFGRWLLLAALVLTMSSCYRSQRPSRFQWKAPADTLVVADTLTREQQDSVSFAKEHHYSQGFNFVSRDSFALVAQLPEEVVNGLETDSFMVRRGLHLAVADVRIVPSEGEDSVWLQMAVETFDMGWVRENRLLACVDPDDPISQFISTFSDSHLLVFLGVLSLMAVGYLMRKIRRRQSHLVHFNDIDSFYPALLALVVALSASLYASIQNFAPEMWREFYFHPSLNPFSQPPLLGVFLCSAWAILIVGLAAVDEVRHLLGTSEALFYLCGLAGVCAVNYIIFSVLTLYYVGYALLLVYAWWAVRRARRR